MKLIKLSEYVTNIYNEYPLFSRCAFKFESIVHYKEFITQLLQLWMFVPVGENGEVLEEPKDPCKNNSYCIDFCQGKCQEEYNEDFKEYQKALDRVLFKMPKGWNVFTTGEYLRIITNEADYYYDEENTIEDIIDLVELNENGIKQAGL